MCYPQTIRDEATGPMQLVQDSIIDMASGLRIPEPMPTSLNEVMPLTMIPSLRQQELYPLYCPDNRLILWELKRSLVGTDTSYHYHRKNRWVVPYTKAFAATVGSNTATYMLGSSEQANGALHYMLDYVSKDPTALANVLSLIYEAKRVTSKYKSTAEDFHTEERRSTHFLNRIVNNISAKSEVSVTMASAALLGMSSALCSHQYQYVYIQPAIVFVKQLLSQADSLCNNNLLDTQEIASEQEDSDSENDDSGSKATPEVPGDNAAGTLYHVDGQYLSVPQHIHYAYRGIQLQSYSFCEYVTLIKVTPKSTNSTPTVNARINFDKRHPLFLSHTQMLKSRFAVPIITGRTPPKFPICGDFEKYPKHKKLGELCATYYMVLLRPWSIDSTFELDNIELFCQWCDFIKSSTASFINKSIFAYLNNLATGKPGSSLRRTLLQKWRGRSATQWANRHDVTEAVSEGALMHSNDNVDDTTIDADTSIEKLMQALTTYHIHQSPSQQQGIAYINKQKEDVERLLSRVNCNLHIHGDTTESREFLNDNQWGNTSIISSCNVEDASAVTKSLSTIYNEESDNDEWDASDDPHPHEDLDISPDPTLGDDQNHAFTETLKYVRNIHVPIDNLSHSSRSQLLLIVHGGPGVGKSTFARALWTRLALYNYKMICCAPTGMAASLLIGGTTIHSLLKISAIKHDGQLKPLEPRHLLPLREKLYKVVVILIDETSMIDPALLFDIHLRLQQIKQSEEPFGGMAVLLVGDFFQMTPVKGTSLFDAALNNIPPSKLGTSFEQGCAILERFKMITFTKQYRSVDESHTQAINRMRSDESPIDESFLQSLKILSENDIDKDPSWSVAPIIVSSNRERHSLNLLQAQRFAMSKNVAILRWRKQMNVTNEIDEMICDTLYHHEPSLTGLFVQGAPANLLENLNPTSGLANGTPIILHSVIMKDEATSENVRSRLSQAIPGEFVDIPEPHAVVVAVPSLNIENWVQHHKSLSSDEVLLPLVNKSSAKNVIKVEQQKFSHKSHPLELGFAITFHKVQGQTLNKVILDLNKRPNALGNVDFHALYVGLTRVKRAEDIRILPPQDNKQFKHLLKLHPSKNLINWLKTFPSLD